MVIKIAKFLFLSVAYVSFLSRSRQLIVPFIIMFLCDSSRVCCFGLTPPLQICYRSVRRGLPLLAVRHSRLY